jgi:acetyl esterase/lipase
MFRLLMIICVPLLALLLVDATVGDDTQPPRISLWNNHAPIDLKKFAEGDAWITVHRPEKGNGTAVVICPGGGYGTLVTGGEGHGIAQWLNRHGITGVVLEYRLPAGRAFVPLLDAQRAIRTVRANAKDWGVNPTRVGIMGFSAGGHLASTAGTHFDEGDADAADPVNRLGCRPDFMILVYPVITMDDTTHRGSRSRLLGDAPSEELIELFSNEKQVSAKTPPTFLAHAVDDKPVPIEHSRVFHKALQTHQVPSKLLELPSGGHGLNGYQGPMWDAWQEQSLAWLEQLQKKSASSTKPLDPVGKIAATLEPTRQLVYKKVGDRELHLHIFEPTGLQPCEPSALAAGSSARLHVFEPAGLQPEDRRPCFITIHGGGWAGGEPRRMYPFADHYARLGMIGISVEYRLLNQNQGTTVFDCVKDGRSAIRYVRSHADELKIDPTKIIVSGGSAGGHVAASTALFDGVDEAGEATDVSCVPNAMVLLFPVIDTSKAGYGNAKIGDRWRELSPLHHVCPNLPPTLLFHGTGDTVTPFVGAQAFHDAMQKSGNECQLDIHPDGKHGYLMFDHELYLDTLRKTDVFLKSHGLLP